jgi:hypothetical protein
MNDILTFRGVRSQPQVTVYSLQIKVYLKRALLVGIQTVFPLDSPTQAGFPGLCKQNFRRKLQLPIAKAVKLKLAEPTQPHNILPLTPIS